MQYPVNWNIYQWADVYMNGKLLLSCSDQGQVNRQLAKVQSATNQGTCKSFKVILHKHKKKSTTTTSTKKTGLTSRNGRKSAAKKASSNGGSNRRSLKKLLRR